MNLCWILLTTLFTFVELNCENLFDYRHEEGKDDMEWTVTSPRHWNKGRYWRKLNNIEGQEIISCGETSFKFIYNAHQPRQSGFNNKPPAPITQHPTPNLATAGSGSSMRS